MNSCPIKLFRWQGDLEDDRPVNLRSERRSFSTKNCVGRRVAPLLRSSRLGRRELLDDGVDAAAKARVGQVPIDHFHFANVSTAAWRLQRRLGHGWSFNSDPPDLVAQRDALFRGRANGLALALVGNCLSRIADQGSEGRRTFIRFWNDQAQAAACAHDDLRRAG